MKGYPENQGEQFNPEAFVAIPFGQGPGISPTQFEQTQKVYEEAYRRAIGASEQAQRSIYDVLAEQMSNPRFS